MILYYSYINKQWVFEFATKSYFNFSCFFKDNVKYCRVIQDKKNYMLIENRSMLDHGKFGIDFYWKDGILL